MKQKHTSKKEDAVSPIVGVMLMLVATIIVAAVVAAFAGGIAGDTEASPNIVISGTYSQTSGLVLKHVSGDSISGVDIYVRPDEGFSSGYHKYSWKAGNLTKGTVITSDTTWCAGEIWRIAAEDIQPLTKVAPNSYYSGGYPYPLSVNEVKSKTATYSSTGMNYYTPDHSGEHYNYGFNFRGNSEYPSAVGKTMIVELHKDGRIIASTPVKIMA